MPTRTIITTSPEETEAIAGELAHNRLPELICLYGDLGAGKTTFVRGLVKALKVKARVQSPTFTYVRIYKGRPTIYHFDLYRTPINDPLIGEQLTEIIDRKDGLIVCEWPERLEQYLPKKNRIDIFFTHGSEDNRTISISTI